MSKDIIYSKHIKSQKILEKKNITDVIVIMYTLKFTIVLFKEIITIPSILVYDLEVLNCKKRWYIVYTQINTTLLLIRTKETTKGSLN